jgi:hypothetical protein
MQHKITIISLFLYFSHVIMESFQIFECNELQNNKEDTFLSFSSRLFQNPIDFDASKRTASSNEYKKSVNNLTEGKKLEL